MVSTDPNAKDEGGHPLDQHDLALAEAVDGLKSIRDEGPDTEPSYPDSGDVEAHESWAFDSASYERAQTARDALTNVEMIKAGEPVPA